jgi:mannosyltransferase OCH1-like enzyme
MKSFKLNKKNTIFLLLFILIILFIFSIFKYIINCYEKNKYEVVNKYIYIIPKNIKPNINPTVNQNINPTVNQNINKNINPTVNKNIKPTINKNINPTITPIIKPTIKPNKQKIPKIIHKTFKTSTVNKSMYDSYLSWKKFNPDYDINFYDNEDCEDFIIDNFPEVYIRTYRSLIPGAFKADFFRLCILYIKGGVYSDIGQTCLYSLDNIIENNDEFISSKDVPDTCIQFSFLCCIPKHKFILKALEQIIFNVKNEYYGNSSLDVTGPYMFGKVINRCLLRDENSLFEIGKTKYYKLLKFEGDGKYITYKNKRVINTKYENYNEEKIILSAMPTYGELWSNNIIFNKYKNVPKIIHLIYIPWNKNQKLKEDPYDFDHSYYYNLQKENLRYDVKLWTLPKIKNFVKKYYNNYYSTIFNFSRPIMIVDLLRILLVYHYGGIYLQYGSKNIVSFDNFLPSENNGKNLKLFTEKIITKEQANKLAKQPIRNNKPEELLRIANQIYSSIPKYPYLFELFKKAISNCKQYKVLCDYDIYYICGNALWSEFYDQNGKNKKDIELIDVKVKENMIEIKCNGSWKKD